MPENDEFKIQLRVADKVYPIFCKRSEEGLFRKAATAVNEKLHRYRAKFSGANLDEKDLLTMVLVHFSVENLLLRQKEDTSSILERIGLLSSELEEYLYSPKADNSE